MNTKASFVTQKYDLVPEWVEYQVKLEPDSEGPYKIDRVTLTPDKLGLFEGVSSTEWLMGRGICPGTYTRLTELVQQEDGNIEKMVWMSDTPAEVIDHWEPIEFFRNEEPTGLPVLITGLGIGMVVNAALKHGRDVWVIERDQAIIDLIGAVYEDKAEALGRKLTIIYADAKNWGSEWLALAKPEQRFEYIWHDIWPKIDDTNILEMMEMFKSYSKFASGPMNAWAIRECLQMDYAIRVDRSEDDNQAIFDLFTEVMEGNWVLVNDFVAALRKGQHATHYRK